MTSIHRLARALHTLWSHSIRRRLALSFGLVAGALMLGFGFLLVDQQRTFLHAQDVQNATHLAQALAASSTSWVLAKDEAGLQEVIRGVAQVHDLKLAMVQTASGQVLGSTQSKQIGFYFNDDVSRRLIDAAPETQVLLDWPNLIDVAVPVMAQGRLIGWARVEITRESANANVRELSLWGLGFALLAVLLAAAVGVLLARRLTLGLHHLMHVATQVGKGQDTLRVQLSGPDELGVLAAQVNQMLNSQSERKTALNSRTSELLLHNQILQEIGHGVTLPHLLHDLAIQIERLHPALHCSIDLLNEQTRCLHPIAAPSLPAFFTRAMDGAPIGEGMGAAGTAAFLGARVMVQDVATDPYWNGLHELAQQAGIQSCWAQPIMTREQRVLGTMTLYRAQPALPSNAQITLVERCAQLAALALERDRSQADLRIAATTFESQEGRAVADAQHVYIKVNQAFTRITGYSAQEALGQGPMLLRSGQPGDEALYEQMRVSLQQTGAWQGEVWHKRKNGEIYPDWLTLSAVTDEFAQVTHYVSSFLDITQRKAAELEIQNLAFYDPLTRLPNRRLLMDRLQQALASCERSRRPGALLLIDLDNFKTLNDTHGHDKGDQLLQHVAQRLDACIRDGDTVARLGGDEFVVMLLDLSESRADAAAQAEAAGEKILTALSRTYSLPGLEQHSSASMGITLFMGVQDRTDELLKQADLALYQAKAAGRNALRFFDPQMQAAVSARAELEVDLREGLQQQQFVLYYQPQVDAKGRITGAEALVRWQHPKRGLVPPLQFIPLTEETALILPLGHWVLKTACQQLALWAQQPHTAQLTLAVNVSARQFHQRDFEEEVLDLLDSTGAPANRLKLELTESLLVADIEGMIRKMTALKRWGVGFSLDDFGTGYSSLSYLKRLPLDQLKIDQSFVRDCLTDPNDASIARAIVTLGQSLGLAVIAEGVETQEQRDFLERNGCHHYQGYLFGRPGPIASLEPLLHELEPAAPAVGP